MSQVTKYKLGQINFAFDYEQIDESGRRIFVAEISSDPESSHKIYWSEDVLIKAGATPFPEPVVSDIDVTSKLEPLEEDQEVIQKEITFNEGLWSWRLAQSISKQNKRINALERKG